MLLPEEFLKLLRYTLSNMSLMSRRFSPNLVSLIVLTSMSRLVFGLCPAGNYVDRSRLKRRALPLSAGFASVASSSLAFTLMSVP